jgi:DNA-binding SARP family transcriptional activator
MSLTIIPDFVVAIFAAWLGVSVLVRTPRDRVARIFGLVTGLVAVWSSSWLVRRLESDADVQLVAGGVTAVAGTLLPAALLHLVGRFSSSQEEWRPRRLLVWGAYVACGLVGLRAAFQPDNLAFAPGVAVIGLAGEVLYWAWIALRAAILLLAVAWMARSWWRTGLGDPRRGQRRSMLAAVLCGALGGTGTIVLEAVGLPAWPGTILVAVSFILATDAVFRRYLFFGPRIARRAVVYSLATGVVAAALASGLFALDAIVRDGLGLRTPVVVVMAAVLAFAVFDPARERLRSLLLRRTSPIEPVRRRLVRALGEERLVPSPEESVASVLEHLRRALGVESVELDADGRLIVGPKPHDLPFTPRERALIDQAAAYVAEARRAVEREAGQAHLLEALDQEQAVLRHRESELASAFASAQEADGLHVFALGPLRVERGREVIRRWGGPKAGTRQAEAIFAFLFDRGERGAGKDELVELIWPDTSLDRADLAFHRTLSGLRRVLEPEARADDDRAITYRGDRYRLDPALVAWSDVAELDDLMRAAGAAAAGAESIAALEAARALYRGEYLDDCPYYGDSAEVEDRRDALRRRHLDLLLLLGQRYEAAGDTLAAAARFREALERSGDDCPPANAALARLGLTS